MDVKESPLHEVIERLEQAQALLEAAGASYVDAFMAETSGLASLDRERLEELLQIATHETATSLGFTLQDIRTLRQRLAVRRRYAIFTEPEFEKIILRGWSTRLVKELHESMAPGSAPDLKALSALVRALEQDWQSIPALLHDENRAAEKDFKGEKNG